LFAVEKSRLKADFNRAAGGYDAKALLQKNVAHNLFSMALERWPRRLKVLDVGAGTGFFSRFAALNNTGYEVLALDIAWRMCELSVREPNTASINADMEMLPLKNESVDRVFSSLALQWVGSPLKALTECNRVLKSGGEMTCATILEGTLSELTQSFRAIGEPDRVGLFTSEEALFNVFREAGFAKVEIVQQPLTLHYPDVLSLLRSIKQIGAASKLQDRNRGMLTRGGLAKLQAAYQAQFAEDDWLLSTWNIAYITGKKA
jgi:malonyl-CoA O-methyltransferase